MNINRTYRLTIVDRKCEIYQIERAKAKAQLKVARDNNLFKVSQNSKKAA